MTRTRLHCQKEVEKAQNFKSKPNQIHSKGTCWYFSKSIEFIGISQPVPTVQSLATFRQRPAFLLVNKADCSSLVSNKVPSLSVWIKTRGPLPNLEALSCTMMWKSKHQIKLWQSSSSFKVLKSLDADQKTWSIIHFKHLWALLCSSQLMAVWLLCFSFMGIFDRSGGQIVTKHGVNCIFEERKKRTKNQIGQIQSEILPLF